MIDQDKIFDEAAVLGKLKHFLPAQAPLKDFVHHNTLHAFQDHEFHKALHIASHTFGYKVYLSLNEYRRHCKTTRINEKILDNIILEKKGPENLAEWKDKILNKNYHTSINARLGRVRNGWRDIYHVNIDAIIHPLLFRFLCSYLDQGISIWKFPIEAGGLLNTIRSLEEKSLVKIFKTKQAHNLLFGDCRIERLLDILVGDKELYEHYLFDQQFAHQGWSGMVAAVESHPESLLDKRSISLNELLIFELLLEIDTLNVKLGNAWKPLGEILDPKPDKLFSEVESTELSEVISILHDAFEWSYFDEVLAAVKIHEDEKKAITDKTFQALFCIDDREASLRRYLEILDPHCETYATPGFFNAEFYYKPEGGKFYTKLCPAPMKPKHLVREVFSQEKKETDINFSNKTHSLFWGWVISQTLGFWSAIQLLKNLARPGMSPAATSSFRLMDKASRLTIENKNAHYREAGLQVGFTVEEMTERVEGLLRSIGLIKEFASLIYVVGHGASSVNNPHYAAYDCGACSGRPGSVNARVFSYMANHPEVRRLLESRGIKIPAETQFIGALHDTTRDDVAFYDESSLSDANRKGHQKVTGILKQALDLNAKERSRRFRSINTKLSPDKIHEKIQIRSMSLFETRPELNHATNALCVIAPRALTRDIFLDRRAFFNSYDYKVDPDGKYLLSILKAAAPVCGGINLEYFFSRMDNYKLGAGTKLPHNVMGLIGVANGIEGDIRPGLPSQMIEMHEPVRLLMIIEHFPEVVLEVIKKVPEVYEWFANEWIHLVAVNPQTEGFFRFKEGVFEEYKPTRQEIEHINDINPIIESTDENLPVYIIK